MEEKEKVLTILDNLIACDKWKRLCHENLGEFDSGLIDVEEKAIQIENIRNIARIIEADIVSCKSYLMNTIIVRDAFEYDGYKFYSFGGIIDKESEHDE